MVSNSLSISGSVDLRLAEGLVHKFALDKYRQKTNDQKQQKQRYFHTENMIQFYPFHSITLEQATANEPGPIWQLTLKDNGAITISPVAGNSSRSSFANSSASS